MPNTCYFVTVHTFDHFISWKPTVCKELHVPDAKGTILKWDTWWGPPGQLEWETRCSLDSWVSEITSLSPWTTSKWGTRRKIKIREGHLGPQRTRAVIWKEIIWTLLKNAWICLWGRGKVLHQKQLCRCPAFSSSLCPRHTSLFSVTPWANFFFFFFHLRAFGIQFSLPGIHFAPFLPDSHQVPFCSQLKLYLFMKRISSLSPFLPYPRQVQPSL